MKSNAILKGNEFLATRLPDRKLYLSDKMRIIFSVYFRTNVHRTLRRGIACGY
jgi:hypothetical protein